jgi:hypothetical protein
MLSPVKQLEIFVKFAAKELGLSKLPKIRFVGKSQNSKLAFGHSIGDEIYVRITDRHPGDVMRTIAHEMIHFKQNIMGKKGKQFREDEANALAGRIMRKYNSSYPDVFKTKPIPSNIAETESLVPANIIGNSSSTQGTGAIDKIDPLLATVKKKKLRDIVGHKALSLRDELKNDRKARNG